MKHKLLLFLALFLFPMATFAQSGGIKGRILSRSGRTPIEGVTVKTEPATLSTISDSNGEFMLDGLSAHRYMVTFQAPDFEPLTMSIEVKDEMRDIYTVIMIPQVQMTFVDDEIFAEFDTETGGDGSVAPSSLSAYKDLFNNIASYKFSEMRFASRGYDSQYSDVYLNGIMMNDAMTGYSPWSLWSGLNDATRNQEMTSGLNSFSYGLGGLTGSTNILARASQMRKGLSVSMVSANAMYRFRAMATYSTGMMDNGWAFAVTLSTRQGYNTFIDGVYYNTYGYFFSAEKQIANRHLLSFTFLGAPTERGVQSASTQEVYDLVGSNYYNPNWGYQEGEMRNTRVKEYHEPIAMLNYNFKVNDRTEINAAASFRFGQNGYSALTWYAGNDPRPDYYRNLPSYDKVSDAAWSAEQWKYNVGGIQQVDFESMYQINYNGEVNLTYGDGHRSNYMIEERHTDQRDANFVFQFSHIFKNNSQLFGGVNGRMNRTEYYSEVKDLLGGDYWLDIDKFAERDFGSSEISYQNNLDYYETYGYAQAVTEGDKYSYDYYANVQNVEAWANYDFRFGFAPDLSLSLGGEIGYTAMWRDGLWRKGLFPDNSYGDSDIAEFLTYNAKAHLGYRFNRYFNIEANVAAIQSAPTFSSAFVSPRTRNEFTPGLTEEKMYSADFTFNFNSDYLKFRASGYYTEINDQSKVISFYNDLEASYDNFAMSGIDQRHYGLEAAVSVPLVWGISLNSAISLGNYEYTSNPDYVEMADNSATALSEGTVYWEGFSVESVPQTAVNVGLSYRSSNYIFASIDCNFYDRLYISMNPLYRTDNVLLSTMTTEQIADMRYQEKMDQAFTLNASIGKSWYIDRKYNFGVSLEVKNLLNNTNIRTGGYEQMRVDEIYSDSGDTIGYERFDSKYFYLLGTNFYLNFYLRF